MRAIFSFSTLQPPRLLPLLLHSSLRAAPAVAKLWRLVQRQTIGVMAAMCGWLRSFLSQGFPSASLSFTSLPSSTQRFQIAAAFVFFARRGTVAANAVSVRQQRRREVVTLEFINSAELSHSQSECATNLSPRWTTFNEIRGKMGLSPEQHSATHAQTDGLLATSLPPLSSSCRSPISRCRPFAQLFALCSFAFLPSLALYFFFLREKWAK